MRYATAIIAAAGIGLLSAAHAAPTPIAPDQLVKPMADYKVYVTGEVNTLVTLTKKLVDDVKKGNLKLAQDAYAPAHLHYERIEPIAELFNDLDGSMDSRADDFEQKEADPKFTGFHRLEKALFADKDIKDMGPTADKLMADALELQKRLKDLVITPKAFVGGTAELIEEVASKKISGEEDRYSRTDLWDFQANVDGAQKILGLINPIVKKQDAALDARIKENFAKVDAVLAKYRTNGGFVSYDKLSDADKTKLKGPIATLAEDLATLRGLFGIS